jgi:hypothetical protein
MYARPKLNRPAGILPVRLSFARGLPRNRQARCLSAETAWKAILQQKQKRPARIFQAGRFEFNSGKLSRITAAY